MKGYPKSGSSNVKGDNIDRGTPSPKVKKGNDLRTGSGK